MAGKSILDKLSGVLGKTASSSFEVKRFINSGCAPLNRRVSGRYDGGWPQGRIIEMFGPSMCGKTALATLAMKSAVDEGGFAMFCDHERSFDIGLARDGIGLDVDSGRFVHVRPDTFEESFTNALNTARQIREQKLIPEEAPIIIVFDSLAAMVPQSKMAKELDSIKMSDKLALANATSQILPVAKIRAEADNITIIMLNQLRENPGDIYGPKFRTPGGKAPEFYSDVRISLKSRPIKEADKSRPDLGSTVTAQVIKTKLTAPFQEAKWEFRLMSDGSGHFDILGCLIEEMIFCGLMKKAGAYIEFDGVKKYKSQWIKELNVKDLTADLVALEE